MTQSPTSEKSFDSSINLEELSLTKTTQSMQNISNSFSNSTISLQHEALQKEELRAEKFNDDDPCEVFVGFMNGGGKKIEIHQSKIKKARLFFEDDSFEEKSQIKHSNFQVSFDQPFGGSSCDEFSLPCFKTVGKGITITVTAEAEQKAKQFLKETTPTKSYKNPTKMKKNRISDDNIVKTVNLSKMKLAERAQEQEKPSFNWSFYQERYNFEESGRKTIWLKKTEDERKSVQCANFQIVKLTDLPNGVKQLQPLPSSCFTHEKDNCQIYHCIVCSLGYQKQRIGSAEIYEILTKHICKRQLLDERFVELEQETRFKLWKYEQWHSNILNKRYNISNLLTELNRKVILLEKGEEGSAIRRIINQNAIGTNINLIVREKYECKKIDAYFLKMSDGWCSVWAAIQKHNILYNYSHKLTIGLKIGLVLWVIHPISNILDYCPQAKNGDTCIEFFYNGSVILPQNARLGKQREQIVRPLQRCREKGGYISTVRGFVLRMYTCKQKMRMKQHEYALQYHFVEILTLEGYTCRLKFILGEERSLVDYFRLFKCYRFWKLKINQEKNLSYMLDQSKFTESPTCKEQESKVNMVLRRRLVHLSAWRVGDKYDILLEEGSIKSVQIQFQIEGEPVRLVGEGLYQQFRLTQIHLNKLVFAREAHSSVMHRIPKLYRDL